MRFLILLLCISALIPVAEQKPLCLITAPNIVHVGVDETVSVQVHGATNPVNVELFFEDQINKQKVLSSKVHLSLNERNNYQEIVKLKVDPKLIKNLEKGRRHRSPYVSLVAQSTDLFDAKYERGELILGHIKKTNILLSTRKGYIFIQTDKPIYTPNEKVKFRIFTLDDYMTPIEETIQISVFNSKGLLVYSVWKRTNQIIQQDLTIPDVAQAGNWRIVASFQDYPMTNSTTEFEVKEFVLPTFEVKIKLFQSYYILKEASFPFNITAKYTYGKGVNGVAYVRFGIIDEQGNTIFLPGIEQQISIQDGYGNVNLKTESLLKTANIIHLEGFHLYIAVTVVETTSGDLEETESSRVKFVITPYTVDLSRTKLTFTPGGPFSILATVSYPDGTPASNLLMKAIVQVSDDQQENIILEQFGNNEGEVALTVNAPRTATTLNIKVIAEGKESNDESLTVTAFQSSSKSYLSIVVPHTILGQNDILNVIFKEAIPSGIPRATHIYYMIISKGKTIRADRVQLTADTTISLPFDHDLVPAFRLIAYYYISVQGRTEIIADSVWVDVEDVCKGKIRVTASKEEYKPAEKVEFLIEADQADKVAVAVVDTAVYILNKQNKLTSKKIFDYMNSFDLGCSVGGGTTTETVFRDAGLTFISSEITSDPRTEYNCKKGKGRQKRSFNFQGDFSKFVNQYTSKPLKKCCYDGAKLSPMNLPCAKRLRKVQHTSSECKAAFLKCCEQASDLRKKLKQKRLTSNLARVADNKEEDVFDETSIHLRSYFPQSWLWDIFDVPQTGKLKVDKAIPDSLTTWEIQTIGISNNKGFCIAEPTQFRVFQDFFISLKLPYSVKRNEQLEVKAVVFNYQPKALEVTVKLKTVEGICSPGNADARQTVTVPGNSAVPVYFSMVPLIIGDIPIHVTAYASEDISDAVEKKLKVVGEGVLITVPKEYNINGKTDRLTVDLSPPDNSIPGLESATFLSIKGGVMGESVENCLTVDGIDKLIQLPTGCAEQTMVKMSPAIHAIKYLDASEQWIYLKAERKDEAIQMIQSGYNRVLQHKKDDGSYGAFLYTPSSIWLTAFIAKELVRSGDYISVEDQYIQQSISYIMSKQLPDGGFNDPNPLYDRTMQGGVGGVEGDVSLTAFVVIAMQHSLKAHTEVQIIQVNKVIDEAVKYLKGKIMSLERPFAVAITAYALALVKPGSDAANQAQQRLRELAQCDEVRTICHWQANEDLRLAEEKRKQRVPQAESISVETTAYALLQTLLVNDITYATPVVRWLTEQRKKGGGFRSTQDTVVALEALSQYSIQTLDTEDINLKVELCFGKGKKDIIHLGKSNALTQPTIEVHSEANIVVNGQGQGNATLTVEHTYRTMKLTDNSCDYFNLHVAVQGEVQYKPSVDYGVDLTDYYNYEDGDSPAPDEPMSRIEWFDIRSRRRRDVADPKTKESTLNYNVCVSTKAKNFSGMAIVDISLLSGLEPDIQELQDRAESTEKYIERYDLGAGKIFLYFNMISEEEDCVIFRAKQIAPIGLVQPANAVIYDYYNPHIRCGVFYSAPKQSKMVSKLCSGGVCQCAEGRCPKIKSTFSKNMDENTRIDFACFEHIVDYAYKVKVLNITEDGVFDYFAVHIIKPLRLTKDEALLTADNIRYLIKQKSCELEMKVDKTYLLMGKDGTTTDSSGKLQYFLDHETWVEEIPEERKCKSTKSREACSLLHEFMDRYERDQCMMKR